MMASQYLNRFQYLPTIGCILFLLLMTIASINYPGGSEVKECSIGYSWEDNYLCDVLADVSHSNDHHHFHRVGLAAMICFCGGISMFFFYFPSWMNVQGPWRFVIKWMGLISMIGAMLIFTNLHNIMIAVSSILALPALIGVFNILYRRRLFPFFFAGILILILLVINNVIYYTDYMVQWLPQIQKISAICIVHWLVVMNWKFINLKKEFSGKNLTSKTS